MAKRGSSGSLFLPVKAKNSIQGTISCGDSVSKGFVEELLNCALVRMAKHRALSQVVPDFGWLQAIISVG